jgi:hypothetical protein
MYPIVEIGCTKDYNKFVFMKNNREINESKVKKWGKIFNNSGVIGNALVIKNKNKLHVFDWQHKIKGLIELGEPINYAVLDMTLKEAEEYVSGYQICTRWKLEDYLQKFIKQGNKNYIKLYNYKQQSGLTLNHFMALIGKHLRNSNSSFKDGSFVMTKDIEQRIINRITHFNDIISIEKGKIPLLCSMKSFKIALIMVLTQNNYCHKRMMFNLKKYAHMFNCMSGNKSTSPKRFCLQLNQIYNKDFSGADYIEFSLNQI